MSGFIAPCVVSSPVMTIRDAKNDSVCLPAIGYRSGANGHLYYNELSFVPLTILLGSNVISSSLLLMTLAITPPSIMFRPAFC